MAHGINFNNNIGARVLDGRNLLPQKIATFNMANYGYYDDDYGSQPGYINRQWWFEPHQVFDTSRPVIRFWEFPDFDGRDIWLCPAEIACTVAFPKTFTGSFRPPKVHIFALDYVTRSTASTGLRAWNPDNGKLIYDSGNQHLGIYEMFNIGVSTSSNIEAPYSTVQTYNSPAGYHPWPAPALALPHLEKNVQYSNRFENAYNWTARAFYALHGMSLSTRLMRTEITMESAPGGGTYRYETTTNGNNLSVQSIFGDRYA